MQTGLFFRFRRHWLSATLFLLPLLIYLVGVLSLRFPEPYQHVLLTITAVMGIHLLDRLFLIRDTEEALDELIRSVRTDVSAQTDSLINISRSLISMRECGIVQIYKSRVDAAEEICNDIANASNKKVKIIGISLNDFVQGMESHLGESWGTIKSYIRGDKAIGRPEEKMIIRVLLIDPMCFGARLRAGSESESYKALDRRLRADVEAAIHELKMLEYESNFRTSDVSFECRLYRLPPILFLAWTDTVSYVQQYHFWSGRDNRTPMPLLKLRKLEASGKTYPYHQEMEHHFDFIWEYASVSVLEYSDGISIGCDIGIHATGATNIYTNIATAGERIAYLIHQAKGSIRIQGISLNSFFQPGKLREAISAVLESGSAEIEILLLDPASQQAKYRSYRERLFVEPEQTYESYMQRGDHEKSDLYHDTNRTIENLRLGSILLHYSNR